jgi:hypothetical protein
MRDDWAVCWLLSHVFFCGYIIIPLKSNIRTLIDLVIPFIGHKLHDAG